ncbi:MAG: polymer-forming cytoskeletal protein [Gammaproteobacteria bacterium]|nr:polymer-forming cytoskeletal protein [Gammaproteobacteria bacterium]
MTKSGQVTEDVYMAGATVQVLADVEGDVVVAGGTVTVVNSVSDDVLAAGGTVTITANVDDDIRLAGGSVAVTGNVGDDAVIAGGAVTLGPGNTVSGRAWLAGATITVAGNVGRELKAAGGEIIVAGTIGGDVELYAESIEIQPSAVIKGNLTYSAPKEAVIHEGARIEGVVNWHELDPRRDFGDPGWSFVGNLVFFLSLAVSAIVLFLIYPRFSRSVVQQLQDAPFKSLGLGLLVLFATPFVVLMLLVSVLGVPLGLIVLALYFVALIAGLLVGIIWIGDFGFRRLGKTPDESKWIRAWSIVAAAAILLIIGFIPFIGGLVLFFVLLLGIGALELHFYRLYIGRGDSPISTPTPAD